MLKNILKLEGAQKLNTSEQKQISGGRPVWCGYCTCYNGSLVYGCSNSSNYCSQSCEA